MRIPKIILEFIEENKIKCPSCSTDISDKSIITIGINDCDIITGKRCQSNIYIRIKCQKCGELVSFSLFKIRLKDFVSLFEEVTQEEEELDSMIEDAIEENNNKVKKVIVKSKITEEEMKNYSKKLNKCNSWEDILKEMAIDPLDKDLT